MEWKKTTYIPQQIIPSIYNNICDDWKHRPSFHKSFGVVLSNALVLSRAYNKKVCKSLSSRACCGMSSFNSLEDNVCKLNIPYSFFYRVVQEWVIIFTRWVPSSQSLLVRSRKCDFFHWAVLEVIVIHPYSSIKICVNVSILFEFFFQQVVALWVYIFNKNYEFWATSVCVS